MQNPYESPQSPAERDACLPGGPASGAGSGLPVRPYGRLRLWMQPYGLLLLGVGVWGFALLSKIPQVHPAFGGPDPGWVLMALGVYLLGMAGLGLPFVWFCWRRRFHAELLYVLPPLTLVAYVAWRLLPR
ncbi:MAG: hypothetical protein NTY19_50485 [Planctomycetota bacterium]|nr:hypothetical protein [Planctomycetota bacterium]